MDEWMDETKGVKQACTLYGFFFFEIYSCAPINLMRTFFKSVCPSVDN